MHDGVNECSSDDGFLMAPYKHFISILDPDEIINVFKFSHCSKAEFWDLLTGVTYAE